MVVFSLRTTMVIFSLKTTMVVFSLRTTMVVFSLRTTIVVFSLRTTIVVFSLRTTMVVFCRIFWFGFRFFLTVYEQLSAGSNSQPHTGVKGFLKICLIKWGLSSLNTINNSLEYFFGENNKIRVIYIYDVMCITSYIYWCM